MSNLANLFLGNPQWNRPTHGANRCVILAGRDCCICVPSTATRVVVEMWGQGGGGAPGRCCSWSCTGGQGGAYAAKVWTGAQAPASTGTCMSFCGCVCACDCQTFCSMSGHPGQFSRLRNCNLIGGTGIGNWLGCSSGGAGGVCRQDGTSYVCINCAQAYNVERDTNCIRPASNRVLPEFYAICGMSTAQSSACNGGSQLCCAGASCYCAGNLCSFTCTGTQHIFNELTVCVGAAAVACGFDGVFPRVNCTCFDTYRLGACGWSIGNRNTASFQGSWNFCDWGVGGAAYAGGAEQKRNFSLGNFAYCGFAGNFPGGGGKSSGSCGGGCCCGSIGGAGLILVSWD